MSGFWIWFWRPLAELAGALFMVFLVFVAWVVVQVAAGLIDKFSRKRNRKNGQG